MQAPPPAPSALQTPQAGASSDRSGRCDDGSVDSHTQPPSDRLPGSRPNAPAARRRRPRSQPAPNTMSERNALSLSTIMASQDARRGGFLGSSAVSLHRLLLVIPALCAFAYPSLLSLAVRWRRPGARVAERTDRLGQCRRVADTGAGGHACQLCIWTDARITTCREPRGLSRPMLCPSGVCHTLWVRRHHKP
jgi:hypothetical protein